MKAAIVSDFSKPPEYGDFPDPVEKPGFTTVTMLAAGVHRVVRSLAAGKHYGSTGGLPMVPGVDGVALLPDGRRAYVGGSPAPYGTLSERTLIPQGFAIDIPDELDSAVAAGIVNPAMSSWLPLKYRADFTPGQTVLILGATGASGRLAVQLAARFGAGSVIVAGRNPTALAELGNLGATAVVDLNGERDAIIAAIRDAAPQGVDVVLDYVWGPVAETALEALRRGGLDQFSGPIHYLHIGALAGERISLDAGLLRSSNILISGSGAGSMDPKAIMTELPAILELAASGAIGIDVETHPLSEVGGAWDSPGRLVFVP